MRFGDNFGEFPSLEINSIDVPVVSLSFSHQTQTSRKSAAADGGLLPTRWVTASGKVPVGSTTDTAESMAIELHKTKFAFQKGGFTREGCGRFSISRRPCHRCLWSNSRHEETSAQEQLSRKSNK